MITKGNAEEMVDISKYSLESGKKVKLDTDRKKIYFALLADIAIKAIGF